MIDFSDLLPPDAVLADVASPHRKALFATLAAAAHDAHGLDHPGIADALADREKLGSTGYGHGIAVPHARLAGIDRIAGVFVRLARPIDFSAVDDLPVDLVFALFSPLDAGGEHLKALARVSRSLRDPAFRDKLRGAGSRDALYVLLTGVEARNAA